MSRIENNPNIHKSVLLDDFIILQKNVKIGADTELKSFIELRENTIIGKNCYIDSGVKTSGDCVIGNNVTLRFNVIIARGVTVKDGAFLAPNDRDWETM